MTHFLLAAILLALCLGLPALRRGLGVFALFVLLVVLWLSSTAASPKGSPRMWTLAYEHHEDRTPTHGYAATREAAMSAFARSWQRE